jgi:hypothetical protein
MPDEWFCGPFGGDIDAVPAEAENGVPPVRGESVPLAEEGERFFEHKYGQKQPARQMWPWRRCLKRPSRTISMPSSLRSTRTLMTPHPSIPFEHPVGRDPSREFR